MCNRLSVMSNLELDRENLWARRFYLMLALILIWRIVYIAIAPLDLVPDESYYWDWSRRLDWGYFSKPPMVAWINALSTGLLGASDLVVRLPAALLSCLAVLGVFLLARSIYNSKVGFWAAALSLAAPGSSALGFIMTIDAPLLACWSFALYLLWRNLEKGAAVSGWVLLLGPVIGLGMLSKEMMLTFPLIMFLFMLLSSKARSNLAKPWPYLTVLTALAMILPTIAWNIRQGWITAEHSISHLDAPSGSFFDFLITFPESLGLQMLIISPLTFILFTAVGGGLLIRFKEHDPAVRMLFMYSVPALLIFTILSFNQHINGNWPAVFYPAGMILLAAWGCGEFDLGRRIDRLRVLFLPAVKVGIGFAVLTYALPFLVQLTPLVGGDFDPTQRLRGWSELAKNMDEVMQKVPQPEKTLIIVDDRRQVVSSLAFYMHTQPRVYRWTTGTRVSSQYELWPGPVDKHGYDALIVVRSERSVSASLKNNFEKVRLVGDLGEASGRRYQVYLAINMLKWEK